MRRFAHQKLSELFQKVGIRCGCLTFFYGTEEEVDDLFSQKASYVLSRLTPSDVKRRCEGEKRERTEKGKHPLVCLGRLSVNPRGDGSTVLGATRVRVEVKDVRAGRTMQRDDDAPRDEGVRGQRSSPCRRR